MSRHREDGSGFRSPLAAFASSHHEKHPGHGREAARKIWLETGLLVANPEHYGWATAARIKQLAEEIHGKRRDDR